MDKMELMAIAEKRGEFELMEFLEGITLSEKSNILPFPYENFTYRETFGYNPNLFLNF